MNAKMTTNSTNRSSGHRDLYGKLRDVKRVRFGQFAQLCGHVGFTFGRVDDKPLGNDLIDIDRVRVLAITYRWVLRNDQPERSIPLTTYKPLVQDGKVTLEPVRTFDLFCRDDQPGGLHPGRDRALAAEAVALHDAVMGQVFDSLSDPPRYTQFPQLWAGYKPGTGRGEAAIDAVGQDVLHWLGGRLQIADMAVPDDIDAAAVRRMRRYQDLQTKLGNDRFQELVGAVQSAMAFEQGGMDVVPYRYHPASRNTVLLDASSVAGRFVQTNAPRETLRQLGLSTEGDIHSAIAEKLEADPGFAAQLVATFRHRLGEKRAAMLTDDAAMDAFTDAALDGVVLQMPSVQVCRPGYMAETWHMGDWDVDFTKAVSEFDAAFPAISEGERNARRPSGGNHGTAPHTPLLAGFELATADAE